MSNLLNPKNPPGSNFALKYWELDLPVKSGSSVQIIPGTELNSGYTSKYFFTDSTDGAMTFWCPANGATTPNTEYPRSELRETPSGGDWKLYTGTHTLSATCEVVSLPTGIKGVYIGQIHGDSSGSNPQLVKLLWGGDNTISIQTQNDSKPGTEPIHSFGKYNLGEKISYNMKVVNSSSGAKITIDVTNYSGTTPNTKEVSFVYKNKYWASQGYYFKAGNYLQVHNSSSESSTVKFYALTAVHS